MVQLSPHADESSAHGAMTPTRREGTRGRLDPPPQSERGRGFLRSARQQDSVDHVDHAVRLHDVADRHIGVAAFGALELDLAVSIARDEIFALDGLELGLAATSLDLRLQLGGGHLAGQDVIGEHGGELGLILRLQKGIDRTGRQLGESLVGRREHGERAGTLERIDKPGGLDGGDERRVVLRVDRILDNVL